MRNQKVSRFFSLPPGFYDYPIAKSCRFTDNDESYLWAALSTPTNAKKWTFSTWIKKARVGGDQQFLLSTYAAVADTYGYIRFDLNDRIQLYCSDGGVTTLNALTPSVYRDPSSWMHIIVQLDTTQAVEADRVAIYVNGVPVPFDLWGSGVAQNIDVVLNTSTTHQIGRDSLAAATKFLDSYLAETIFVDGQALTPSSFGELKNGIWVPKPYAGTFGNNGFRFDYSDGQELGTDRSGNGNDFAENGLQGNDQMSDTPTNNFCTLNSIHHLSTATLTSGNLRCTGTENEYGTFALTEGKWSWIVNPSQLAGFGVESEEGDQHKRSIQPTEVVEFLFDADNGTFKMIVDGGSIQNIELSVDMTKLWFPYFNGGCLVNFGQTYYTPEYGYNHICSRYLAEPSILEGRTGMDVALWTGNSSQTVVSGLGFQPDFVWIKGREPFTDHRLYDVIRQPQVALIPNERDREIVATAGLTSFNSDGFTVGADQEHNKSGDGYVAWCLKRDPKYGLDIKNWRGTGATYEQSHDLGVVPEMIIVKNHESIESWPIYHKKNTPEPETDYLLLDSDGNTTDESTIWDDTLPTNLVFTVGSNPESNGGFDGMIAYIFASVPGFSRVFGYTGNGNENGPFIYCGFRPKFLMFKNSPTVPTPWPLMDGVRNPVNPVDRFLPSTHNNNETTTDWDTNPMDIDFLSNGFKIRSISDFSNESGALIVGIAFAESPFKYANAR